MMSKEIASLKLPDNWIWIKLSEITLPIEKTNREYENPNEEFKYIDIESINNNSQTIKDLKIYRWGNAPSRAQQIVKTDDILFATVRPYLKNIAIVSPQQKQAIASSGFCIIRTITVNPKYVFYYISSHIFIDSINQFAKGTSYPAVTNKVVLEQTIPLPSLVMQNQIVFRVEELLSELDQTLKTLNETKSLLNILYKSLLKRAFDGKLTEEWRIRNSPQSGKSLIEKINENRLLKYNKNNSQENSLSNKIKKLNDSKFLTPEEFRLLPKIPKDWTYTYLSEIGNLQRGKSKHRPRNDSRLFGHGYPFIQTGDVRKAKVTITSYSKSYSIFGLQQSKLWEKGTLCITIAANIAETAFLGFDACFPDSIVGFINDELISSKYVYYFFQYSKERISSFAPSTAQKNINLNILENLYIPICSLDEQLEIVNLLDQQFSMFEKLSSDLNQCIIDSGTLKQTILKKAFEGNLVAHISDNDSTDLILKEIKAEKLKYLNNQNRKINKSVNKRKMSKKLSIEEVLKVTNEPMLAIDVWKQSEHNESIDEFYAALKKIEHKIIEVKDDSQSKLSLK